MSKVKDKKDLEVHYQLHLKMYEYLFKESMSDSLNFITHNHKEILNKERIK